jgi:hypothetical protein
MIVLLIMFPDLYLAQAAKERRFQRRRMTLAGKLKELEKEDCEGVIILRKKGSTVCSISGQLSESVINGSLDLSSATIYEPQKKKADLHTVVEKVSKSKSKDVVLRTSAKSQTPGRGFLPATSIRSIQLSNLESAELCATTPEKN